MLMYRAGWREISRCKCCAHAIDNFFEGKSFSFVWATNCDQFTSYLKTGAGAGKKWFIVPVVSIRNPNLSGIENQNKK